jgi:hypothetical protein
VVAPTIAVPTSFAGLNFDDGPGVEPPDTIAAAGPNHVVELVNTDIRISNKAGSALSTEDLTTFFGPLNPQNMTDPAVMYDESAGRFIVSALDYALDFSSSALDVAVSNDSDPTHGFTEMHQINLHLGPHDATLFGDYPREGLNADAYFFSVNMFDSTATTFEHVQVVTINKASVLDANNATFVKYQVDPPAPSAGSNFTMAPATMHGAAAGGPMYFVEETNVDTLGDGLEGNTVHVIKWTNVLALLCGCSQRGTAWRHHHDQ